MIDLTGANLTQYIIRIARDVVSRHPRFLASLGTVSMVSNTSVNFGDLQVIVKGVSSQGNRLSPDYFMCTKKGRAFVAKVTDKEGNFVEWLSETSGSLATYQPGVFYMAIDSLDESSLQIGMTIAKFLWKQGVISNAEGSRVYVRPGIALEGISLTDSSGTALNFLAYPNYLLLLSPAERLILKIGGVTLTPNVDFWYQRDTVAPLTTTLGGVQQVAIPTGFSGFTLEDQDEYTLRPNIDYYFITPRLIELPLWTPPGSILSIHGTARLDPSNHSPVHPENYLNLDLQTGQTVSSSQVIIYATSGNYNSFSTLPSGTTLPLLLSPGEGATWECRVTCGQFKTFASKMELNNFYVWVPLPLNSTATPVLTETLGGVTSQWTPLRVNGNLVNLIPGVQVAIGDMVALNDQAAIIVSPSVTETYEVYGSKENVNFTLDIKANDNLTASEISELLKREFLVSLRSTMENDGVSILEASRSYLAEQRDQSGTAPRYTYSLGVTALCDWKMFIPLVTRVTNFDVLETIDYPDFSGKLSILPRVNVFGENRFVETYKFVPSY